MRKARNYTFALYTQAIPAMQSTESRGSVILIVGFAGNPQAQWHGQITRPCTLTVGTRAGRCLSLSAPAEITGEGVYILRICTGAVLRSHTSERTSGPDEQGFLRRPRPCRSMTTSSGLGFRRRSPHASHERKFKFCQNDRDMKKCTPVAVTAHQQAANHKPTQRRAGERRAGHCKAVSDMRTRQPERRNPACTLAAGQRLLPTPPSAHAMGHVSLQSLTRCGLNRTRSSGRHCAAERDQGSRVVGSTLGGSADGCRGSLGGFWPGLGAQPPRARRLVPARFLRPGPAALRADAARARSRRGAFPAPCRRPAVRAGSAGGGSRRRRLQAQGWTSGSEDGVGGLRIAARAAASLFFAEGKRLPVRDAVRPCTVGRQTGSETLKSATSKQCLLCRSHP